jgi:hypothetical protein
LVPGRRPLTPLRRRAILALLAAGAIVWLLARQDSHLSIVGLEGPASSALGPLLPALSAGLTIAMTLVIVDVVGGPVVAVLAALCVLLLPDFLAVHRASLIGPPLLATTIGMLAVMLAAPRFSLAYGAVAAIGAVWVSPQAVGLVPAAVAWALMQPNGKRGRLPRAALALLPLALAILLTLAVGSAWPSPIHLGWRGGLDTVLRAIGHVLGTQQVPAITSPALRWVMVADTTLILLALGVMGWRRAVATAAPDRPRRFYPAVVVLAMALSVGLVAHAMLLPDAPLPNIETAISLAVLATLATAVSVSVLWPRWPWWGKAIAALLLAGWIGGAVIG